MVARNSAEVEVSGPLGVLRSASDLVSRAMLAIRNGLSFRDKRDMYEALGYQRRLFPRDYRGRFERGGIAARVVDAYPKATWRGGAEIQEDPDPQVSTVFEEEWDKLNKRLHVWSVFNRADILAGLGQFSLIMVGAPGDVSTPLPTLRSTDDILYLSCFGEEDVTIASWEKDKENARFGLPLAYNIKRLTPNGSSHIDMNVHYTRVIHVVDGMLDDQVLGTPRLDRVWNNLDDLDKCVGGGSEAFWLRVHQGYFFEVDPTAKIETDEIKKMKEQSEEFAHGMRRTMAMRGAKINALGSNITSFGPQVQSLISLISGATGIPQRILLGSERGELASSQDKENWDTRVQDRRMDFAEPIVVRPFVDLLMKAGALPQVEEYEVVWPKLNDLADGERATIAVQWATLNSSAGETVVTGAEIREKCLGLEPMTEADLMEHQDLLEMLHPTPPQLDPGVDPNAPPNKGGDNQDPNAPQKKQVPPPPAANRSQKNARRLARAGRPKDWTQPQPLGASLVARARGSAES